MHTKPLLLIFFLRYGQMVTGNFILTSVRDCGGKMYNVHMKFSKLHRTPDRNPVLDIDGIVKHSINMNDLVLVVSVSRCQKLEAPDTCVTFKDFKSSRLCEAAFHPMYAVASIFKCVNISTCDVKPGRYTGTKCIVDSSMYGFISLGNDFWTMYGEIYHKDTKAPIMCYKAVLKGS